MTPNIDSDKFPISEAVQRECLSPKMPEVPTPSADSGNFRRKRQRFKSLSAENHQKYVEKWNELDQDNDGKIEKECIVEVLVENQLSDQQNQSDKNLDSTPRICPIQLQILEEKASEIIEEADISGDGSLTKQEFIGYMHENDKRARIIFNELDSDNDGVLTITDIINHEDLKDLDLSEAQATAFLIELLDEDLIQSHWKDGQLEITRDEFRDWHISELFNTRRTNEILKAGLAEMFYDISHKLSTANIEFTAYISQQRSTTDDNSELSILDRIPVETFLFGGIAGAISRTTTAPLDRLKVFFQVHERSTRKGYLSTLRFMYSEGGLKSLWRGNFVNVMKIFPETGLKFGIFETIKNNFCGAEPSKTQRFFAGATAGAMAQTCIYPIEVLKTRMVLRSTGQFNGVFNCARTIVREEGFRAFGRGYLPTVFGIFPYAGLELLFAETAKGYLMSNHKWANNSDGHLYWFLPPLIGGSSSFVAGTLVYPVNLIRTKMQAMRPKDYVELGSPLEHRAPYIGQIVKEIHTDYGFRGFYHGIGANLTKAVAATSITFGVWEYLKIKFDYRSK
ncbi:Oidioi.mRNA.OKI2018_I69.chr1.g1993.t1.cds [Oikopleura dioica]|uniref:Oidioi.mRNA.OKI2018_I69.chr1.g1993.t1.cds n=1 Tax=Oikopleura dioica TaxID=34765 RepID=A0ABN7STW7_OIKDI|nr:Oidioi.mRNA.OKI2018_I69.chr1.g1993.t1.cds [Oikopleura dioica]